MPLLPETNLRARRALLKTLAGGAAALALPQLRAQTPPLRIGQSIALTGPLADVGQAMHEGGKVCFSAFNARGGVNGQQIELVARDDAYQVPRAVGNVEAFIAEPSIFGLFTCMGTPMVAATLPQVKQSGIPYFTPLTGAMQARPADMRNVFNVRASYPQEAEELIKHLFTIGLRKIAVVYQNNAFGKEVFYGANKALTERSLSTFAVATVESDASDVSTAITKIADAAPEAVLIGLAGKPALQFIQGVRKARRSLQLYTTSVMGAASTISALGNDAVGLTLTQVVPSPTGTLVPIVRDFQQDWKASGTRLEPSHIALEGYINARVFIEDLRRTGRPMSRNAFMDAAWGLRNVDLGGYRINARMPGTSASDFVELTMISRDGRFIR